MNLFKIVYLIAPVLFAFLGGCASSQEDEVAPTVPVAAVSLDRTSLTLSVGERTTLRVIITPSNATCRSVTWDSSYPAVAAVDANGVVTAVAVGRARISVTSVEGAKQASCEVTVTDDSSSDNSFDAPHVGVPKFDDQAW